MAVSVTSNLTLVDTADSTTDWDSSGNKMGSSSAAPREGTASVGEQASTNELKHIWHDLATATNLSNTTIFLPWMRTTGPGTFAQGGFCGFIGDGTNQVAYHVGGVTNFGSTARGWSRFLLDTGNLPTTFTVYSGAEASLDLTNLTEVGGSIYNTTAPSGQALNVFFDIIRYISNGSKALTITGGTDVDRGTFGEVVTLDESTSNAWGIIFQTVADSKAYELLYGIQIGDTAGASYFDDSDFQLFILGTNMSSGNLDILVTGDSASTNLFSIDNFTIINTGTVGNWNISSTNLDTMTITNGQFVDCGTFSFPPSGGTSRKVTDCVFTNCGRITPDTITFQNNTINGSTDANGALLLPSSTTNFSDIAFNSDGTGHAIEITSTGEYTLTNISFSGYGSDGTTDAAIYNNSGGSVTLNISGGTTPTVRNGTGASTTLVINPVDTTITVQDLDTGSAIESARVLMYPSDGTQFPYQDSVSIVSSGTTATVTHTSHGLSSGDYVIIEGANEDPYNGVYSITVTGADTYTYTMNEDPADTATGTLLSTLALLSGTTDINGQITDTRSYSSNQDVSGWVRKASSSPYYKQGTISATVDSNNGLTLTIQLAKDE